jgi:hypothetical protein
MKTTGKFLPCVLKVLLHLQFSALFFFLFRYCLHITSHNLFLPFSHLLLPFQRKINISSNSKAQGLELLSIFHETVLYQSSLMRLGRGITWLTLHWMEWIWNKISVNLCFCPYSLLAICASCMPRLRNIGLTTTPNSAILPLFSVAYDPTYSLRSTFSTSRNLIYLTSQPHSPRTPRPPSFVALNPNLFPPPPWHPTPSLQMQQLSAPASSNDTPLASGLSTTPCLHSTFANAPPTTFHRSTDYSQYSIGHEPFPSAYSRTIC